MKNIEHFAEDLFNKIRNRFDPITIGDENAKPTDDPRQARIFNFEYTSLDGVRHGEITISLIDNKSLKITFNKSIGKKFDPAQENEWEQFLRNLRQFAKRNMVAFDVRDINRTNLKKRDLDQEVKSINAYKTEEIPVIESIQWYGTTRTSIQEFGSARLIIRHSERVNEEQPGARSRKIESMFVETDQGERFRMPYNKLGLGRAMAQHLAHGGKIYDEAGQYIQGIAEEMSNLAFFVRNTRHRQFEDTETTGMVESAIDRYKLLRSGLQRMGRPRGYYAFAETFVPECNIEEDYDIEALKERFVKKMFDDRLTDALPYVYRAYRNRKVGEGKFVAEFSDWTNQVEEDNVRDPEFNKLKELMAKPIIAGVNGIDAQNAIISVIDNDELNDLIVQATQSQGQDIDVRPIIDDWFQDNFPEYVSMMQQTATSPVSNQTNNNPRTVQPQRESLGALRRLAGLL
jgi:hypothetical protein